MNIFIGYLQEILAQEEKGKGKERKRRSESTNKYGGGGGRQNGRVRTLTHGS